MYTIKYVNRQFLLSLAPGGFDGEEFLASIEVYDPQADLWTLIGGMTCGRSGHAVAVGSEPC